MASILNLNSQILFEEQSIELGINVILGNTTYGNGVSFCDFDDDGWDDITLATQNGFPVRFFKNNNGNFNEVYFNIDLDYSENKQVIWVDYDNDGDKDLFVTSNTSGNKLYKNNGNSNFEDITLTSGLPTANLKTSGVSWGDINNDGFLDLFLSNYDFDDVIPNYLFLNNGNDSFLDVSSSSGISDSSDLSWCSVFFDFNNDGYQDIYIANDRVFHSNILYKNLGNGTFIKAGEQTESDINIDAMSTTIADYNNDGYFDIYVTNTAAGNVFLKNVEGNKFIDVAQANGTTFNSIAWGSVFLDADNDADLDLYVSGSLDGSNPSLLSSAFYENNGSGLYSIAENIGIVDNRESYSNAIGDINNDGSPDILVNNADNGNISLWKNLTSTSNNWLKVILEGVESNKDGIGSLIEISFDENVQFRYTICGEGYLAQNSNTEFFGIGDSTIIDYIKVTWLSGIQDIVYDINPNQILKIVEGTYPLNVKIEEELEKNINIFPNPIESLLVIKSNNNINSIAIFDLMGKQVYTKNLDNPSVETSINLGFLNSGIYILKINQEIDSKPFKIIKL